MGEFYSEYLLWVCQGGGVEEGLLVDGEFAEFREDWHAFSWVLLTMIWDKITTIGAGTFIVIMHPKFRSSEWRPFRAAMFIMMGLSAIVPVLHGLKLYGLEQMQRQIGLSWLVLQGVLYITGAVIYAVSRSHCPVLVTVTDAIYRPGYPSDGSQGNSICLAARIRSSTYWCC